MAGEMISGYQSMEKWGKRIDGRKPGPIYTSSSAQPFPILAGPSALHSLVFRQAAKITQNISMNHSPDYYIISSLDS
jgi:hypothetical protein